MSWEDILKLDVSDDMYDYVKDALIRYIIPFGMSGIDENDVEEMYSEKKSPYQKALVLKHIFNEEMIEREKKYTGHDSDVSWIRRSKDLWNALSDAMVVIEGTV